MGATITSEVPSLNPLGISNDHSYLSLTSFYENGRAITNQVWYTVLHGKIYVITPAKDFQIKRVRATGYVEISPTDVQGRTIGKVVEAKARLIDGTTEQTLAEAANASMRQKYGLFYKARGFLAKLNRDEHLFLEIYQ